MTFEMLIQNIKGFILGILERFGLLGMFDSSMDLVAFAKDNLFGLILGVAVATMGFIFYYSDFYKGLREKKDILGNINHIMKKKELDFDEAKDYLIAYELSENMPIDKKAWHFGFDKLVYSCQRIAFKDKEVGMVRGYFIGLIEPEIIGYDDIYVVRMDDGTIRQAPVTYAEVETINVFK